MIFNMALPGGGSSPLSFDVVGGSEQPSAPGSGHRLFVKTAVTIPDWSVSAEAPASPGEGTTWFRLALSGDAEINALKEQSLTVALDSCQQYVSGEWINVDAYLWTGSSWVQFGHEITVLFEGTGSDGTSQMANWTVSGWTHGGYGACAAGTVSNTALTVSSSYNGAGSTSDCVVGTASPVDLTKVKLIRFTASVTGAAGGVGIAAATSKSVATRVKTLTVVSTAEATYALDVSDLTGTYYLLFWGGRDSTASAGTLNITKVWYEADRTTEGSESDTGGSTSGDGTEEREETGTFWDDVRYFVKSDFACTCGGAYCDGYNSVEPAEQTVRVLDEIRRRANVPITITSAIRCPTRNAQVGGVSNSLHITGQAVDISAGALYPYELLAIANEVINDLLPSTQGGLGKYSWGIHVDNGPRRGWEG